ncbi:MAG: helix-turn-helix transcriptional regulator [Cyanobacteria bacterium J06554_6]
MTLTNEAIRALREEAGLTRLELSYKTGIGMSSLRDYEVKGSKPSLENAAKISRALKQPLDVIALAFGVDDFHQDNN